MTPKPVAVRRGPRIFLVAALAVLGASLVWAHWTTLTELARRWAHDPQYSHGYLVPGFAVALLWLRRDRLRKAACAPSWWGLVVLGGGIGLRLVGTYYHYVWLEAVSLLPCVAGLFVTVGGWPAWRWSWPAVAFLFYMIPLPYRVAVTLSGPLQRMATIAATFALQTLGLPALAEGNVILLNEVELGVVEACSGLRMLVIFFAISTAVALVSRRPLGDRIAIVVSAVPIALFSNLLRIIVTGVLHETVGSAIANAVFHDLAGWLMMPLALGLLWLELAILSRLLIDPKPAALPRPAGNRPRQVPPPQPRRSRAARRLPPRPSPAKPAGQP
jgi:exosortase